VMLLSHVFGASVRYHHLGCKVRFFKVIITETIFMVLSSWQSHCESSPGSFDECRQPPGSKVQGAKTYCKRHATDVPFVEYHVACGYMA